MQFVEAVNTVQSSSQSPFASRLPMNIASVRATSLRSSGLRAAFRRRGADALKETQSALAQKEKQSAVIETEMNSCLSSSPLMASSTHLSYTHSQDPGEDSQLNAIAMVDKLVNLDSCPLWDVSASNIVADHPCMKGPQSMNGIQSLARNADAKKLQEKMGIYDWIDSQPDVNGDVEQVSPTPKGQQEQLEGGIGIENRKAQQGRVCDVASANDTCNPIVINKKASLIRQQNSKVQDTDARYEKGDAEMMDIGANTQIALEAMDFLRCGIQLNHQRVPSDGKALVALNDTGHDVETEIMLDDESAPQSKKANSCLLGIGNDTQSAIDVIDAMRHGAPVDLSLSEVKATSSSMGVGDDTQSALDAIEIMRQGIETDAILPKVKAPSSLCDIGNDTQTAIEAIDILRHRVETDPVLSNTENQEMIEQGSRAADLQKQPTGSYLQAKRKLSSVPGTLGRNGGEVLKTTIVKKLTHTKGSFRAGSKSSKSPRPNVAAVPDFNSNKRLLLDFSSAMVPRRKRSRLCVPRGTFHVFGCQDRNFHPQKPLTEADKQAQTGKPAHFDSQKSALFSKRVGNSLEGAVVNEATNGESVRRTKKKASAEQDCSIYLEGSRKRRKCEPKCIFVLFSHSLSEATIKQQKKMLINLGGHVTTIAAKATHFVADSFTRSRNMLEIMAAGKAVVTTMWLEGCSQAKYFVDEKSYILQDAQKEKQWGFCMLSSLATSRRKPLFKGMKVMVSPNTAPDFEAIKAVVECAGGQVMQRLPSSSYAKEDEIASISFVIGSEEDHDFCAEFLKKGCKIYSTELILHGVVTQSLDFSRKINSKRTCHKYKIFRHSTGTKHHIPSWGQSGLEDHPPFEASIFLPITTRKQERVVQGLYTMTAWGVVGEELVHVSATCSAVLCWGTCPVHKRDLCFLSFATHKSERMVSVFMFVLYIYMYICS